MNVSDDILSYIYEYLQLYRIPSYTRVNKQFHRISISIGRDTDNIISKRYPCWSNNGEEHAIINKIAYMGDFDILLIYLNHLKKNASLGNNQNIDLYLYALEVAHTFKREDIAQVTFSVKHHGVIPSIVYYLFKDRKLPKEYESGKLCSFIKYSLNDTNHNLSWFGYISQEMKDILEETTISSFLKGKLGNPIFAEKYKAFMGALRCAPDTDTRILHILREKTYPFTSDSYLFELLTNEMIITPDVVKCIIQLRDTYLQKYNLVLKNKDTKSPLLRNMFPEFITGNYTDIHPSNRIYIHIYDIEHIDYFHIYL